MFYITLKDLLIQKCIICNSNTTKRYLRIQLIKILNFWEKYKIFLIDIKHILRNRYTMFMDNETQ